MVESTWMLDISMTWNWNRYFSRVDLSPLPLLMLTMLDECCLLRIITLDIHATLMICVLFTFAVKKGKKASTMRNSVTNTNTKIIHTIRKMLHHNRMVIENVRAIERFSLLLLASAFTFGHERMFLLLFIYFCVCVCVSYCCCCCYSTKTNIKQHSQSRCPSVPCNWLCMASICVIVFMRDVVWPIYE